MEKDQDKKDRQVSQAVGKEQDRDPVLYPESVESMSSKWRLLRRREDDQRGFFERNYLVLGVFIGLLIFVLLIVFGGFAFLVWNAR